MQIFEIHVLGTSVHLAGISNGQTYKFQLADGTMPQTLADQLNAWASTAGDAYLTALANNPAAQLSTISAQITAANQQLAALNQALADAQANAGP